MLIPIENIQYTTRDFKDEELEDIVRLTDSIRDQGLLHPITVERNGESYYILHAGLKRLIACKKLKLEQIDCLIIDKDLPESKKKEIHLHENLFRFNLPWYETVLLEKELLELRQTERGIGQRGKKVGFSLRDLADELGKGLGTLSEDMRLAEAVLADPNLRKIEDKITAKRLIFNTAKRIEAEEEAQISAYVQRNQFVVNTVLCGDATEILKFGYPNNTFDVCFTDPPWLEYKDKNLIKDDKTFPVFKEIYRVLKNESFLFVICSMPDFFIYRTELAKLGFDVQDMPLIWHKQNVVTYGLKSWQYMRDYEPILLAAKGSPVLSRQTRPSSVYRSPVVPPVKLTHPNEKPIDVPMYFLEHCSYENSLILDPFGGSGSTGEACVRMKRRYVIIERNKQFAVNIERRLNTIK